MILTCPECATKFNIKDGALGTDGRKVKCSKCDHRWHAMPDGSNQEPVAAPPPEPDPVDETPQIDGADPFSALDDDPPPSAPTGDAAVTAPPPQDGDAADTPPPPQDSAEPLAAEAAEAEDDLVSLDPPPMPPESSFRQSEPERSGSAIIGWIIFILVVGGILFTGFFFRKDIVSFYPPLNKVYELFGIAPDILGHGLKLPNWAFKLRREGKDNFLDITGKIENTTGGVIDVPAMKGVLFDSAGKEIYNWNFKATEPRILPGEKITYTTQVKNPPPGSVKLTIVFSAGATQ
jgi:predicted Zn finger-like uncharacterized protein